MGKPYVSNGLLKLYDSIMLYVETNLFYLCVHFFPLKFLLVPPIDYNDTIATRTGFPHHNIDCQISAISLRFPETREHTLNITLNRQTLNMYTEHLRISTNGVRTQEHKIPIYPRIHAILRTTLSCKIKW